MTDPSNVDSTMICWMSFLATDQVVDIDYLTVHELESNINLDHPSVLQLSVERSSDREQLRQSMGVANEPN